MIGAEEIMRVGILYFASVSVMCVLTHVCVHGLAVCMPAYLVGEGSPGHRVLIGSVLLLPAP